jgi:hypothetical protein
MDDPASILGRAVPVLMTGPVKFGHFQYGDRDLVMFVDGSGMFFFWQHNTRHPTHTSICPIEMILFSFFLHLSHQPLPVHNTTHPTHNSPHPTHNISLSFVIHHLPNRDEAVLIFRPPITPPPPSKSPLGIVLPRIVKFFHLAFPRTLFVFSIDPLQTYSSYFHRI